jgi:hypothetical protein
MNNKISFVVLPMICFGLVGFGQEVIEPDLAGIFYGLQDHALVQLERQTNTMSRTSVSPSLLIPFHGVNAKSTSVFPGSKSPVRLHSGETLDFVVRTVVDPSSIDPNTLYSLRRLDKKKNSRETSIVNIHVSAIPFGGSTTKMNDASLLVEFSRYGAASLKLHTGALIPGEYAITASPAGSSSLFFFCFGVD